MSLDVWKLLFVLLNNSQLSIYWLKEIMQKIINLTFDEMPLMCDE